MPTSKETRVRDDGFSEIITGILPASGLSPLPALRLVLRVFASSMISRRSSAETAERSRKCFADAINVILVVNLETLVKFQERTSFIAWRRLRRPFRGGQGLHG